MFLVIATINNKDAVYIETLWIHVMICIVRNNISTIVWRVRWHNNRDASRRRYWQPTVAGDQAEWKTAALADIHPPYQRSSHIPLHPGTLSSLRCRSVSVRLSVSSFCWMLLNGYHVTRNHSRYHFHIYCILFV